MQSVEVSSTTLDLTREAVKRISVGNLLKSILRRLLRRQLAPCVPPEDQRMSFPLITAYRIIGMTLDDLHYFGIAFIFHLKNSQLILRHLAVLMYVLEEIILLPLR